MKKKSKRRIENGRTKLVFRTMPVLAVIIIGILIWCNKDFLTIENLLKISPTGNIQAIIFMMLLYCTKSLSIILPINPIYILGSRLFSKWWAFIINLAGLSCGLLLQYMVGKVSGSELIDYLRKRYTKIDKMVEFQDKNSFSSVFVIRLIGMLPMDLISMYYGACKCNMPIYLFASILGMLPNMVLYTLLGVSLSQPDLKMFWIVLFIKIILILCTLLGKRYYNKEIRR